MPTTDPDKKREQQRRYRAANKPLIRKRSALYHEAHKTDPWYKAVRAAASRAYRLRRKRDTG